MAYMSQERKKSLEPKIKEILKKYGVKARLGVNHHSTLVLNITSGTLDFAANWVGVDRYAADPWAIIPFPPHGIDVNHYHLSDSWKGKALEFFTEVKEAMMVGNHDRSDIQSDYFDVGWHIDINLGKWDKPYELTKED